MQITIIHPSRGRAAIAKEVYDNWMSKADNRLNVQYILSIDRDDRMIDSRDGQDGYIRLFHGLCHISINGNDSAIQAINHAAKLATGDLLIVVSDDFTCPQHWDTQLLEAIAGRTDFVAKTDDGCGQWIITLPIMDRTYYNRFGYIYHPGYLHMFCDTEMTHVGILLDKMITLPLRFQHKHYSQPTGIKKDDISIKNDATWNQGERLYLDRVRRNFDLPAEQITGTFPPKHKHVGWLYGKGIII